MVTLTTDKDKALPYVAAKKKSMAHERYKLTKEEQKKEDKSKEEFKKYIHKHYWE